MKLFNVIIRRDSQTITPVTIPEHEVALLQAIHGEDNVHNADGKRIADVPLSDADLAGECADPEDEFGRLASKYGSAASGELVVEQVFGKKASKGLDNAMKSAKAVKKAKE